MFLSMSGLASGGSLDETILNQNVRLLWAQIGFEMRVGVSPVCRAEHRSFWTDQPVRGAAGKRRVAEGAGAPFGNPVQKRGAQGISGIRAAFLLDTFLWRSKEKYLAFGCENPIKTASR